MMDEKQIFLRLTWPTGAIEAMPIDAFALVLQDYFLDAEEGEEWKISIMKMTQEEFESLPEFMGP